MRVLAAVPVLGLGGLESGSCLADFSGEATALLDF